jgi:hypothetical protein
VHTVAARAGGSASANNSNASAAAGTSSSRSTNPGPGSAAGSRCVAAAVKVAASARNMLGGLLHGCQQSAFGVSCCCLCTSLEGRSPLKLLLLLLLLLLLEQRGLSKVQLQHRCWWRQQWRLWPVPLSLLPTSLECWVTGSVVCCREGHSWPWNNHCWLVATMCSQATIGESL